MIAFDLTTMLKNKNTTTGLLLIATALFALGPALLKLLTTMGGAFSLRHPGAISFCNVLFVGNLCAGLTMIAIYGASNLFRELVGQSKRTIGLLLLGAIVSTIYPALLFTALERTSVINIVLLSRFNGIVFVGLSAIFFGSRLRKLDVVGYALIGSGVAVLVVMNNGGFRIQTGELLVLIAAIFFALTEFISRRILEHCSVPLYVFVRNFVSALMFFIIAVNVFGLDHFSMAFVGELWLVMIVYAGLAVVAAQLLWLRATMSLPVKTVANSQLLNPSMSLLFAFLLLGEVPNGQQWSVMAIVVTGMLLPRLAAVGLRFAPRPVFARLNPIGIH